MTTWKRDLEAHKLKAVNTRTKNLTEKEEYLL